MNTTAYYPVIQTADVAGTADFYIRNFRFKPLYTADWYVHLQSSEDPSVNIAVLDYTHETIPEEGRKPSEGFIINFEVADPDAEYDAVVAAGLPIVKSLRDEAFGQRHFITKDPNGILIDVIRPIQPEGEHVAEYETGAAGV